MSTKIIISPCGCVSLPFMANYLSVIDSENLPITGIGILGIRIENDVYLFEGIFASKQDVVNYLNSLPALAYLQGVFIIVADYIKYENFETFTDIEIMAIYKTEQLIFAVGTPPDTLAAGETLTAAVANGTNITDAAMIDRKILSVRRGTSNVEPVATVGYENFDPITGSLDYAPGLADEFVYITVTQIPA